MDIHEVLNKKFEDKKQMLISALAQGSAKDFADYQHLCGRIRGLTDAQTELNDLLLALKEKDED
jgi:hypothetical protein